MFHLKKLRKPFFDKVILYDERHSDKEKRYFCLGKVEDKILTVRFFKADFADKPQMQVKRMLG